MRHLTQTTSRISFSLFQSIMQGRQSCSAYACRKAEWRGGRDDEGRIQPPPSLLVTYALHPAPTSCSSFSYSSFNSWIYQRIKSLIRSSTSTLSRTQRGVLVLTQAIPHLIKLTLGIYHGSHLGCLFHYHK